MVKQLALDYDEKNNEIVLHMDAGDTMRGCRELYNGININKLKQLMSNKYKIDMNFHLAHYGAKNFLYLESKYDNVVDYVNYGKKTINRKGKTSRF